MPKWIHDRAQHLMKKNPDMDKSQAFAIATQQSHAAGKTPKGYGTDEGKKKAKKKYSKARSKYEQAADPKEASLDKLAYHQMRVIMKVHSHRATMSRAGRILELLG